MAIYSRFGEKVIPVRMGTVEDFKTFEGKPATKGDRANVEEGLVFVARFECDGKERLCAVPFMRADGGAQEIMRSLEEMRSSLCEREQSVRRTSRSS